jgi:hypothetical protein
MKAIRSIAVYLILAVCVAWTMVSCSFQASSDGAKSFNLEGKETVKAIKTLLEK